MTALNALGTVFRRDGQVIASVKDITGPELTRDVADVTALDAPNGFEQVLPTVLRTGDLTFALSFDPDIGGHLALRDDLVNETERAFEVEYRPTVASGTVLTYDFQGFVTGFSNTATVGSEVTADVTIKPTGAITATLT